MREARADETTRSSRWARLGVASAVGTTVVLLASTGWRMPLFFNPDAVAYVRIASYWAEGRLGLAVNGYWGPMLSWLIAPWLGLLSEPVLAARVGAGLGALLFVLAGICVLQALGLRPVQRALGAWILALFTASRWLDAITPDFLLSALLCFALALLLSPAWILRPRRQWLAGVLFGVAYLTKAVALPFAVGIVVCTAALNWLCRAAAAGVARRAAGRTLLATAAIAAPWIVAISFEYGRPVFSTSGAINHAFAGPGYRTGESFHPFASTFHVPEPGRVTAWEDPSRMDYAFWSPLDGRREATHQARIVYHNARYAVSALEAFDWLGLGLASALLGFLLHAPWRLNLLAERWRWAVVPVVCLVALYLPVAAENVRYYYACLPFLLAAGFGFVDALATRGPAARWPRAMAQALVSASFLLAVADGFYSFAGFGEDDRYRTARALAERLREADLAGSVASVGSDLRVALFLAFLLDEPFLGNVRHAVTQAEAAESGASLLVVERGSETDRTLASAAGFRDLDDSLGSALAERSLRLYQRTAAAASP